MIILMMLTSDNVISYVGRQNIVVYVVSYYPYIFEQCDMLIPLQMTIA